MVDPATPPTLLMVGGARAVSLSIDMALEALNQARSRGIRTHVTNQASVLAATPSVIAAADLVSAVGFTQPGETVDWAKRQIAEGGRFDAVFALQEMAQVTVAETAEALGAPANPPDAVRCVRTKDACRTALAAAGFRQPAVQLCHDATQAEEFISRSTGPWIVKPRDAMGSVGVSQVTSPADLPAAIALLPDPGLFLVEEFVDGPEFSVEGVFLRGVPKILAITEKETVPPPFFVEIGHVMPAELPPDRRREIEEQVSTALTTVGLRTGAFHVELWLTDTGVVLGELHVRFGGDWLHRMLAHAIPGLELFGLVFDDMLGRPVNHASLEPTRGAAVRYFTPPPGRLIAIEGWSEAQAHPAVLYSELTVSPGAVIRPPLRSSDRVGLIVVGGDTPAHARKLAMELTSSVHFIVEPEPDAGPLNANANANVR